MVVFAVVGVVVIVISATTDALFGARTTGTMVRRWWWRKVVIVVVVVIGGIDVVLVETSIVSATKGLEEMNVHCDGTDHGVIIGCGSEISSSTGWSLNATDHLQSFRHTGPFNFGSRGSSACGGDTGRWQLLQCRWQWIHSILE